MSEAQFWRSNPRIIAVWRRAYQDDLEFKNGLIHSMVGTYGISALAFAIDHCLNGKKAKSKYIEKPLEIIPKDNKGEIATQNARNAFLDWAESMRKKYTKVNEEGGS